MRQDYAYITVLTNERYIPGVKALAQSMSETGKTYPLYVLIPSEKKGQLTKALDKNNVKIDGVIEQPSIVLPNDINVPGYFWNETFFKLQAARLVQFKKIVLIDSDVLVQKNLDNLFKLPHYSATIGGKSRQKDNPNWNGLSSACFVIEPSIDFANDLIKAIPAARDRKKIENKFVGDEDVYNQIFLDWYSHKELHISELYNCFFQDMKYVCREYNCRPRDLFIVHFVGEKKPWEYGTVTIMKKIIKSFEDPKNIIEKNKILFKYLKYTK